jgi:two-component system chemotaxis response regulator CheY
MNKKTVVIVDDSHFIIKQLVRFFREELDYEVIGTGSNGIEGVELYKRLKPDLITLDIVMEPMDGLDTVEAIISKFPDARIMMISAVRTGEMLDCITLGAKGYVEKPLQLRKAEYVEDFKATLEEIFND